MPDALNTKPVQSPREPPAAKRLSDLALRFTLGKLNANECDHTTLIALIAWLLLKSDEAIATQRIISGLRGLDRSGCPPLAPGRGYNETVAGFWITIVRRYLTTRVHHADPARAVRSVVEAFAGKPELIFDYFSRRRLHSWEARAHWIEPDIKPLPDAPAPTDRTDP
ncbi:MAG: hypothetical protein KDA31_14725 [Phycisphaerales bacterium]|nr:hypothetical protein [Phycisphaerales bacterium]MCB9837121.1 hypothetical protein [Phycisphaera sp.]